MGRLHFFRSRKCIALLALSVVLFLPLLALAQGGLVVCTGPTCNFCHLFLLASKIVKFLIYTLAMPIAALLFAWAGILYITAAGNTGQIGKAKKIFTDVLLGLLIAITAALVVDLILRTFTGQNLNFWTTDKYDVSKCEAAQVGGTTPPPPTESPPPPPPPPAGDPFQQNKETLALLSTLPAAQWQGATSGSCFNAAGAQVSAVTNRSELSAGVPLTVCSSGCNTSPIACKSGTATLNPNALNTLLFLAQEGVGFTVTSISTGSHSPTSQHYALRAVDISAPSVSYSALSAKLQTIPAVSKVICENSSGETACTDSSVNHIHFEVR